MEATTANCRRLVEALTDYLERSLPEEERSRLDAHLAACEGCARHLEQLRATVVLARRAGAPPLDAGTRARLLRAFRGGS